VTCRKLICVLYVLRYPSCSISVLWNFMISQAEIRSSKHSPLAEQDLQNRHAHSSYDSQHSYRSKDLHCRNPGNRAPQDEKWVNAERSKRA